MEIHAIHAKMLELMRRIALAAHAAEQTAVVAEIDDLADKIKKLAPQTAAVAEIDALADEIDTIASKTDAK